MPFGLVPLKVASVVAPESWGAGAWKSSPGLTSVGSKLPLSIFTPINTSSSASSSKTILTPVMSIEPPTSFIKTRF
jgi:hypothetical protein